MRTALTSALRAYFEDDRAMPIVRHRRPASIKRFENMLRDAKARGCTRDIGEARRGLREARHSGLLGEVRAAKVAKEIGK